MPRMTEITDDERDLDDAEEGGEENLEGDTEEGEGEQPKPKARKESYASSAEVKEIHNTLKVLTQLATRQGTTQDQAKVSKLDTAVANLLKNGYKPEQLEALLEVAKALQSDIADEDEGKAKQRTQKEFNQACWRELYGQLEKVAEKNGLALESDEVQMLAARAGKLLEQGEKFSEARDAYRQGVVPSAAQFSQAARTVFQTYMKGKGMNSSDNRPAAQLDLGSSRSKAAPSSSKNDPIDLSKLSDFEKEVYTSTKNITKNEELARKALNRVRGR